MISTAEIAIDFGGSSTKISIAINDKTLTTPVIFKNADLFSAKSKAGRRVAQSIRSAMKQHSLHRNISTVAISMSGNIDHINNMLLLSHRLDELGVDQGAYGKFDVAKAVENGIKQVIGDHAKVYLLHDTVSACLDPKFSQRLVLAFTLGTYPVLGLVQKVNAGQYKVYDNFICRWVDEIVLPSTGQNITMSLRNQQCKKRDSQANCNIIKEAAVKILQKYQFVFKWQPKVMVILGGNASAMIHLKEWPKQVGAVKMIQITDYEESIKTQMHGALFYSKNKSMIKFV